MRLQFHVYKCYGCCTLQCSRGSFHSKPLITYCQITIVQLQGESRLRALYHTEGSSWETGRYCGFRQKKRAYISMGELQSTVSLTWCSPTANTRVCHWLSASPMPRNTHCSTASEPPFIRKCNRFGDIFNPRRTSPGSGFLLTCISICCFFSVELFPSFVSETASFSSCLLLFKYFGASNEKTCSFLCVKRRRMF